MWSKETLGWEKMEGNADANTAEWWTSGDEKGGGGIIGALVVATPTLNKGAAMVDRGASTRLAEAVDVLTLVAGEVEIF